ncbi:MAG: hypothetical protein LC798_13160 [Chloroflexi bacterium]|nr:hypothetical protein [Chloroflexota bacterium]
MARDNAKDGKPADLEDERRKRAGGSDPLSDEKTVEERAGEAATQEEDDGQVAFVVEEHGRRMTLNQLIQRGTPVEHRIVMGSKSTQLTGGLLDPTRDIFLAVRGVLGDVKVAFTRDAEESIDKVTIYQNVTPKNVQNAQTEAGRVLLHGEPQEADAG